MSWRKIVAMVLVLLVLVTSSRAATICVEQDGNARLEFVGATCCVEPSSPSTTGTTVGSSQCAGCDDVPFGVTGRLVSQKSASADLATKLLAFDLEPTTILVAEAHASTIVFSLAHDDSGQPSPRDARPAHLRC